MTIRGNVKNITYQINTKYTKYAQKIYFRTTTNVITGNNILINSHFVGLKAIKIIKTETTATSPKN